jgi:anti-anti-sigma regulatory factor
MQIEPSGVSPLTNPTPIAMPTILVPAGDLVGEEGAAFLATLATAVASSSEVVIDFLWVDQGDQALLDGLFSSLQTAKASGTTLSWISMNATLQSRWQMLWATQSVHPTLAPIDFWLPRFEQFLERYDQEHSSQHLSQGMVMEA